MNGVVPHLFARWAWMEDMILQFLNLHFQRQSSATQINGCWLLVQESKWVSSVVLTKQHQNVISPPKAHYPAELVETNVSKFLTDTVLVLYSLHESCHYARQFRRCGVRSRPGSRWAQFSHPADARRFLQSAFFATDFLSDTHACYIVLGEQDQEIPLPNVSSDVLEKASCHVSVAPGHTVSQAPRQFSWYDTYIPLLLQVLEYCEYYRGEPLHDQTDQDDTRNRTTHISGWDQKFITVDQEMLFEIILAANFLDIKPLM